jgi:3-hydroxy acid dehydrogenase/malonic semialdehyde reductase
MKPGLLDGQVALITGAGSGIGAASAMRLSEAGARVILMGRRADRLRAVAAELARPSAVLPCDVCDRQQSQDAIASLSGEFANVDILVNCAGLALGLTPAHQASLDDWDRMIETNCTALAAFTRLLLPGMISRGRGHVVNLGSVAANYPYPGGHVYAASKAFVHQFSQALKSDLAGTGVRVTVIEPGMVETEFSVVRFGGDKEKAKAVYAGMIPLTADDIADIVLWSVTRPRHVNVNVVEVMPVDQGFGPFKVSRRDGR